ncbi:MAG: hypothetical protein CVT94_09425 [Bacteroidetes bacterium HGW-Bacteroidetes-11]|nr:MAG: hypothetical protein CVT94_09425 [Bacteroidetes bacterium HGW-Bacteroidetes-11]
MRPRLYFCAYRDNKDVNHNTDNQENTTKLSAPKYDEIGEFVKKRLETLGRQLNDTIKHYEIDPFGEEDWDESPLAEKTDQDQLNPEGDKKSSEISNKEISSYSTKQENRASKDQNLGENAERYCVKIENMNFFRHTIKEIRCEVAVSEESDFSKVKTIKLSKRETLFLRSRRSNEVFEYVFWFNSSEIEDRHKYIRVRLLASNFLGVKKHYERHYKLEELSQEVNRKTQCQCWHKINTNKLTFNFVKTGVRCLIGAKFEKLFDSRA